MSDNITAPAAGTSFATKDIGGIQFPKNLITDQNGADILGELADSPSANSIAGRAKAINTSLATIAGYLDGLEGLLTSVSGYVDGLETLSGTTNTSLTTLAGYVDGLEALQTTLAGYVDGLETLSGTTNTTLTTLNGYVDGLEALHTSLNGYVDGLEALHTATNVALGLIATEATLTALSGKLPASLGIKTAAASLSMVPASDATFAIGFTSGGNMSAQTNATGSNWTAFASQALKQLTVVNDTGTKIDTRQDAAGVAIPIPDGNSFTFFGISNANQIGIRRNDTSNTQVTAVARWEA